MDVRMQVALAIRGDRCAFRTDVVAPVWRMSLTGFALFDSLLMHFELVK